MNIFTAMRIKNANAIAQIQSLSAGFTFTFSTGTTEDGSAGTVVISKVTACYVFFTRTTTYTMYGMSTTLKTARRMTLVQFLEEYGYEVAAQVTPASAGTAAEVAPAAEDIAVVAPLAATLEAMAAAGTLAPAIVAVAKAKKVAAVAYKLANPTRSAAAAPVTATSRPTTTTPPACASSATAPAR